MQDRDKDNAPLGGGTGIAVAVGAVAFLACWLILGFSILTSLLVGVVLFVIVYLVLGRSKPGAEPASPPVARPAAPPAAPPAPTAAPATEPAAPPAPEPAPAAEAPAARPPVLEAARGGAADDLKKIKGVGPKLEAMLNRMGFYHYDQIASWTPEQIAWVDENLEGFKGRVSRDEWVAQAKTLAAGGETEFSKRQG